jgi:glycosyltransferase involved in cell wall biosynthesis
MTRSMARPRIVVLTHFTSPYQVELFDAVAATGRCTLDVLYLSSTSSSRSWQPRAINHAHLVLGPTVDRDAEERVFAADLAVFNYYNDSRVATLLDWRMRSGKPWCFWGERPGARQYGWAGQAYRRWMLGDLKRSRAPIWGIGRFALEQYRREFGAARLFLNVPYFSDLERFRSERSSRSRNQREHTTFLFSGALIHRKGADLLARAFLRLALARTDVRLTIMGDGDMRASLAATLEPVSNLVEFTGFRDWDDLPAVYAAADVLCVPSRHDGWGLVVPEGLAAGLPVIATNRTGAALELLRPRSNGWLIPADDETALFRAMSDAALLGDKELRACAQAALGSVADHTLVDGANRFLSSAEQSLRHWSALAA